MVWTQIEEKIVENEEDGSGPAPMRRPLFAEIQKTDLTPGDGATKKMVSLRLPDGNPMLWELTKPAENFFLADEWTGRLQSAGLQPSPRNYDRLKKDGGRHSALSRTWSFGEADCVAVRIGSVEDFKLLSSLVAGSRPAKPTGPLSRLKIEEAMDAYDEYVSGGKHGDVFERFGPPRDFWVRSTRTRPNRIYPSKPINFWANGQHEASGGWASPTTAAAALHNSGYVIVNESGQAAPVPADREHLIADAERIRLCALNYYIEPARERRDARVSIRVGNLHEELGLNRAWPNICQALSGPKFQTLANVPPPSREGPDQSTSTTFTYALDSEKDSQPMENAGPSANNPTNLILYGPPGTGKTYATAEEAVRLCDGDEAIAALRSGGSFRSALMQRYKELCDLGQISFVTFHQSYAYEDFIEGLRPHQGGDEGGVATAGFSLRAEPGVFTRMARSAMLSKGGRNKFEIGDRQVFKMSIGEAGNPDDDYLFEEAISEGCVLLGWGDKVDWRDPKFDDRSAMIEAWRPFQPEGKELSAHTGYIKYPNILRNRVQIGDLIVVSKGNSLFRGIAEVTGPYDYAPRDYDDKANRRAVRWLWVNREGAPVSDISSVGFVMGSIYQVLNANINRPVLERYISSGLEPDQSPASTPFVLIIDEINRANISKVFGELITLIEPDKRLGALNELKVQLPYSREMFGVPANLHIVGTMNTADRSIALLDTALRRRFSFRELMPEPDELDDVDGISLGKVLRLMNERIEYLFDREHQIGHAFFINCRTRDDVDEVMRRKVIPLLSEYFYEDWSKVATVLGDADGQGRFLIRTVIAAPPGLSADSDAAPRYRWHVRESFADSAYDGFQ